MQNSLDKIFYITIEERDENKRLDKFLLEKYEFLNMGLIAKMLRTKYIKVNNIKSEISYKLKQGDIIKMLPIDNYKIRHSPKIKKAVVVSKEQIREISNRILYKDLDVMVINKPSDLAVQGGTGIGFNLDAVLDYLKFESDERPCLVHRLDKDTTGTILIARNSKMAAYLLEEFKNQKVKKIYYALSFNSPTIDSGTINEPLLKVGDLHNQKIIIDRQYGKEAITKYKITKKNKFASLISAEPLTGRTHQIRVHLSSKLKCPIIGDFKYGFMENTKININQKKLYLHAHSVEFRSINGKNIKVEADLDSDFQESLKILGLS